jgi:serine/threonine-protein kinase RsbW
MPPPYQLVVPASIKSISVLYDLIDQVTQENPIINEQLNYDLMLCMDEACSNIIEHGYEGLEPGFIFFCLNIDADRIEMTITDSGHPFDPNSAAPPDLSAPLDKRPVGGLGLFFIKKTMDKVDYQAGDACNTMILTKYLR